MGWNHRVMRKKFPDGRYWFSIREVYYDEDGKVDGWTVDDIAPGGETVKELRAELKRMLACLNKPVLDADVEILSRKTEDAESD